MSAKELREQIADLEREVAYYKGIAARYRACLGDVRANEILIPFLAASRQRDNKLERLDFKAAFKKFGGVI